VASSLGPRQRLGFPKTFDNFHDDSHNDETQARSRKEIWTMCCHRCNRREFLGVSAHVAVGTGLAAASLSLSASAADWAPDLWDPGRAFKAAGEPLSVQPVLMYRLPTRREAASWKSWGGIQTEAAVAEEVSRITSELTALARTAEFPVTVLPVQKVRSVEEASSLDATDGTVRIIYPATGSGDVLRACVPEQGALVFVRHQSGPVYYWYEALSVKYLRTDKEAGTPDDRRRLSVDDVVVDDTDELLWRLRALYGVYNFRGTRGVALGGPGGKYAPQAPAVARERYGLDIVDVSYEDLGKRIEGALRDGGRMAAAERWANQYLSLPNTTLATDRQFVVNAFVLYGLFKEIVAECSAEAFTIKGCMSTILPMSKTTACLTLSLLNDEGLPAFCESDFVIIPAGILLYYLARRPVFLHNSTFPHKGLVTCAHCTGPRRMDGSRYEAAEILTHYESEYGAAPKVNIPVGQEVTFIDPEYATPRWIGFKGTVEANPFYDICRSQQDVRIHGNWEELVNEARDSHWVMVYGDFLREVGYAAPRLGIAWEDFSET